MRIPGGLPILPKQKDRDLKQSRSNTSIEQVAKNNCKNTGNHEKISKTKLSSISN